MYVCRFSESHFPFRFLGSYLDHLCDDTDTDFLRCLGFDPEPDGRVYAIQLLLYNALFQERIVALFFIFTKNCFSELLLFDMNSLN